MIDLRPACQRMAEVLTGVGDDQLTGASPCADYTVADLVDHVHGVAVRFAGLARGEPAEPSGAPSRAEIAALVGTLGAAWADPAVWPGRSTFAGLELANAVWGRIALTEVVVHGWDLATATGQPFDLPDPTLRACLDHVVEFVPNAPVPAIWGPAVAVPADAPLLDRILGVTGRKPR